MPAFLFMLMLMGASGYETSIEHWRAEREAKLKAEDGWLSLAGLFWLEEGPNRIGSAANMRVQLPAGFPVQAGVLTRRGDNVHLTANPDAGVRLNGQPVKETDIW